MPADLRLVFDTSAIVSAVLLKHSVVRQSFRDAAPVLGGRVEKTDWRDTGMKTHEQIVYTYRSLADVRQFGESDALTGDEVLPGFSVAVAALFED